VRAVSAHTYYFIVEYGHKYASIYVGIGQCLYALCITTFIEILHYVYKAENEMYV